MVSVHHGLSEFQNFDRLIRDNCIDKSSTHCRSKPFHLFERDGALFFATFSLIYGIPADALAGHDLIGGHVKWTDTAANMIQEREYRFLSPTFKYTPVTRKVMALSGAGLVHKPNLHLTALASEESTMPDQDENLSAIAKALGLPAQSDQSEILTAINAQTSPDLAKFVPIEAVRDLMTDRTQRSQWLVKATWLQL